MAEAESTEYETKEDFLFGGGERDCHIGGFGDYRVRDDKFDSTSAIFTTLYLALKDYSENFRRGFGLWDGGYPTPPPYHNSDP